MSDRKIYIDKMSAKLKEWESEIQKLEAKADMAKADVKDKYRNEIEKLSNRKQDAHQKLKEIQSASKESWVDLKKGLESAWASLGVAVKQAASRFQ